MKDCVGLETAKKLQDAGIDFGQTAFVWVQTLMDGWELRLSTEAKNKPVPYNIIPTTTTNEMLEWLPEIIEHKNVVSKSLDISRIVDLYIVEYADIVDSQKRNSSLQEALAKLCLWVRKEGHK